MRAAAQMRNLLEKARNARDTRGSDLLGIYLNDHLAGSTSGVRLAYRLARSHGEPDAAKKLLRIADEIAEDREQLLAIMAALGVEVRRYKVVLGAAVERAGRLKSNGRILQRSPLSTVAELEALRLGVEGKLAGWRSLREVADVYPQLDATRLRQLENRAAEQADVLEQIRVDAAAAVFAIQ